MVWFILSMTALQDPGATSEDLEALRRRLKSKLHEIRKRVDPASDEAAQDSPQPEVTLEDLLQLEERLEHRLQDLEHRLEIVNRTASKNAFNPKITAFGNFASRADNRAVRLDNTDPSSERIDDRGFFRSAEFDFRAAIDPFAEGVIIVSAEGLADGGFEAEVEEAYMILKRIPILGTAPGGVKIKTGKYRPPFGVSNRLHLHDMPHITRPLVVTRYLGGEQNEFFEAGFNPLGIEARFLLPDLWDPLTIEVYFDALQAGETALTEGNDPRNPAFHGHLDFFFRLGAPTTLNLGVSQYRERGALASRISGADVTFVWKPDQFKSIVAGVEAVWADREFDPGSGPTDNTPAGGYAYVQLQVSPNWYFGVRFDRVEDAADDDLTVEVLGAYVSYYTSEFLRIRLGIENRNSDDIPTEDDINTVMLEFNFVIGAHPVEPYWVNR